MNLYDFLQLKYDDGCCSCPFIQDCDQGGGYTEMDEHGSCPVEDINTDENFETATFPSNYPHD